MLVCAGVSLAVVSLGPQPVHVAAPQQVLLEVRFIEADRTATRALGFNSIIAGDEVVGDASHFEVSERTQLAFDAIGDGRFVVAHRRDVDELRGEREQIGHVVAP